MTHYDYIIADVRLRSECDLVALGLRGFAPFMAEVEGDADCLFAATDKAKSCDVQTLKKLSESYLAEADAEGVLYKSADGYLYRITPCGNSDRVTEFAIDTSTMRMTTNIFEGAVDVAILRFGLWILFGVVLASHNAIAIHSSAIECEGRVVLFLGESGTGKSTHTRLWREHITGARLLNDDSPIVRFIDGKAIIYGSPWSGKTPCYKNMQVPLKAVVRLSQAPYNKIARLAPLQAFASLMPACSCKRWDNEAMSSLHKSVEKTITMVPCYHLECLPDEAAAMVCYNAVLAK